MGMYCDLIALPSNKIDDYLNDEEFESDDYPKCSLDKMWHGLNFILNSIQNDEINHKVLEYVIFGEDCLNPEVAEDGDFPTNYNKAQTVKQLAVELQKINFTQVIDKVDFNDLSKAEIYPNVWDDDSEIDDIKEELQDYFANLLKFYQTASDKGYVVLSQIG